MINYTSTYMKIAAILGYKEDLKSDKFLSLQEAIISCGHNLEVMETGPEADSAEFSLPEDTDMLLCLGGDGTYLRGALMAAKADVPILGVNFGHLGFLSENSPEDTAEAFRTGSFVLKERNMLNVSTPVGNMLAVNEIAVRRSGPAMLGVVVGIDGVELPTCWGDGMVVASAAGSTAYNLSVGGPIVYPSAMVHIISPIAPHNLNVRPLVVPNDRNISLRFICRDESLILSADTKSVVLDRNATINISMAQFSLKRLCLGGSNFIRALCDKLSWGEDKRNERQ